MEIGKSFLDSEKFGRFEWTLDVKRNFHNNYSQIDVFLFCRPLVRTRAWSSEAEVNFTLIHQAGLNFNSHPLRAHYNNSGVSWGHFGFVSWQQAVAPENGFVKEGFLTFAANVTILRSENILGRIPMMPHFDKHVRGQTDEDIKVGGEKLYVSKTLLSMHSAYFAKLFDGEGSYSVPIEKHNVTLAQFKDLLMVIYAPERLEKVRDLEGLLRAAFEFRVANVLGRCGVLLVKSDTGLSLAARLRLASKYKLIEANEIVNQITTISEIHSLETTEEWKDITTTTRAALLARMFELRTNNL